ncbi:AbrB/MazE/SpoVT family DNA-binding domain-containing protein [Gloeocapsa sp. PCC 73106]|uniref:AbrB/MazE/SpoVT family DNA-binding domain-containing protein n=1 Tax=Gloeocapsa sp. PCC 73106 TaxID=102232 RepID=UPI0002AC21F4|nr:AbrB/MazE/SpoVT family DNA-binding domain-containing protein [Gloeocapsa sp. PCC 73106]ELR97772.1 putative addiction module antidote [Gloeocapsa sp. PCC 73106]
MILKLSKIGNSLGTTFPPEIIEKLNWKEGDTIYVHETTEGIELIHCDSEFEIVMEASEEITRRYHKALRDLAS